MLVLHVKGKIKNSDLKALGLLSRCLGWEQARNKELKLVNKKDLMDASTNLFFNITLFSVVEPFQTVAVFVYTVDDIRHF